MWALRALPLCWLLASPERTDPSLHLDDRDRSSFLLHGRGVLGAGKPPDVEAEALAQERFRALPPCRGSLALSGVYEVKEKLVLQGPCNVSATGAQLRLRAPIVFNGSVTLTGDLKVVGKDGPFQEACVSVHGGLLLSAGAQLGIEGCRSSKDEGEGGCLRVEEDLEMRGGVLAFTSCHAEGTQSRGGAAYVRGNVRLAGELHAESCSAKDSGGALYSFEKMAIVDASLQVHNAWANKDGGALYSAENVTIANASFQVHNVRAGRSGGALSSDDSMAIVNASLQVRNATVGGFGGALHAKNHLRASGRWVLEDCRAHFNGGALYSFGSMTVANAFLQVQNATAGSHGGAICSGNSMTIANASLEVHNARAGENGGSLYAYKSLEIANASLEVYNTRAKGRGGALHSARGSMTIANGSLEVHNARAGENGGALHSGGSMTIAKASFEVHNARAGKRGGAMHSGRSMTIANGFLEVHNARAGENGGALSSSKNLEIANASLDIRNATAKKDGGALSFAGNVTVANASLEVHHARAGENGGALYSGGNITIVQASFEVHDTTAGGSGGALCSHLGSMTIAEASLEVHDTTAGGSGGALYSAENMTITNASLQVRNARAGQDGGALFASGPLRGSGRWVLENCQAEGGGGGIFIEEGHITLTGPAISCSRCLAKAGSGGAFHVSAGRMTISGMVTVNDSMAALGGGDAVYVKKDLHLHTAILAGRTAALAVGGHASIARLLCTEAVNGCYVEGSSANIAAVQCQRGGGLQESGVQTGCLKCAEGQIRLAANSSHCQPCPSIPTAAVGCDSTELEIPPGYMVNTTNLTDWYRCPNTATCPGGIWKAGRKLEDAVEVVQPMCALGYEGPGCMRCAAEFAWADSTAMQCIRCSTSQWEVVRFALFYLAKQMGLFMFAVATVTNAKRDKNNSSAMLNQLMAFAAVASVAMSGAMQTGAFRHLQESAHRLASLLESLQLPIALAQGQSTGAQVSSHCLLSRWGLDGSFVTVHWATSILPAFLVAILLAAQGLGVAVVVGVNVFLPAFTSAFGRYLVAYRLRPEGEEGGRELRMDFLPSGDPHTVIALVLTAIVLCFLFAIGSWSYIVWTRKEPFQQHVAFLTASYKPSCSAWEVERLARKMLLGLLPALLPVSLSPALQMGGVSLILLVSLVLYIHYQPYKVEFWNQLEMALLLVALAIMIMTSCLVANDFHWANSGATQAALLFTICLLASGVSVVMIGAIALAFYDERRGGLGRSEK